MNVEKIPCVVLEEYALADGSSPCSISSVHSLGVSRVIEPPMEIAVYHLFHGQVSAWNCVGRWCHSSLLVLFFNNFFRLQLQLLLLLLFVTTVPLPGINDVTFFFHRVVRRLMRKYDDVPAKYFLSQ